MNDKNQILIEHILSKTCEPRQRGICPLLKDKSVKIYRCLEFKKCPLNRGGGYLWGFVMDAQLY